jgi:hypothetical protein
LALRTAVFANCDAADAWLAKNDPEENLPQLRLGVGSSLKKTEQLLMEPERKSSPRNCCCETVARRYETAHVADSQRSLDPLFKNKRSRTIAKGGGLYSICKTARADLGVGRTVVRNHVDIDTRHSRAIVREIGERLRSSLKEDRELPANFRMQIERLRQSEEEALAALDPAQSATRQHRKSSAAVGDVRANARGMAEN